MAKHVHLVHRKRQWNWLVVWNMAGLFFHSVGNVIIPTDELTNHDFFSGLGGSTTNQEIKRAQPPKNPELAEWMMFFSHLWDIHDTWKQIQGDALKMSRAQGRWCVFAGEGARKHDVNVMWLMFTQSNHELVTSFSYLP